MHNDSAASLAVPTAAGAPFEGGFYVGTLLVHGKLHALIVADKAGGELADAPWHHDSPIDIPGARSFFDGLANTKAMAEAGSATATWALDLRLNGLQDWYLPSRDELELIYRNLKPTTDRNYTRYGDNPSSVPPGYPYSAEAPLQTPAEAFKADGAQAMEDAWYWSSTQRSADYAWGQFFGDGSQINYDKSYEGRARAVRRLVIE